MKSGWSKRDWPRSLPHENDSGNQCYRVSLRCLLTLCVETTDQKWHDERGTIPYDDHSTLQNGEEGPTRTTTENCHGIRWAWKPAGENQRIQTPDSMEGDRNSIMQPLKKGHERGRHQSALTWSPDSGGSGARNFLTNCCQAWSHASQMAPCRKTRENVHLIVQPTSKPHSTQGCAVTKPTASDTSELQNGQTPLRTHPG